jgi:pimeloyl-ACP methyl ester carboxylesterase
VRPHGTQHGRRCRRPRGGGSACHGLAAHHGRRAIDAGEEPFGGVTEGQFATHGFRELLEAQSKEAEAQPDGLRAAHLGITRLVDPLALHREGVSLERGTDPSVRSLLRTLQIPRWYLQGELSDPQPDLQHDLAAMGVGWKVVPKTGHAMGLQNPAGLAQAVAEAMTASWTG